MIKKTFLVLICSIGLIIFISALYGQGSKKTITLPSGEVVWDLNGQWDTFVENYGPYAWAGSYPQITKITQTGSSFVGIRMIPDPFHPKIGSQSIQGELDKNGIKKVTIFATRGPLEAIGRISEDGNKIVINDGETGRLTLTRK